MIVIPMWSGWKWEINKYRISCTVAIAGTKPCQGVLRPCESGKVKQGAEDVERRIRAFQRYVPACKKDYEVITDIPIPVVLHSFFSLYFFFSSFEAILYPEINQLPCPEIKTMESIANIIKKIMKCIDKGYTLWDTQRATGADKAFVEDVARMYLTHQNISIQGILDRIEIKGK